MFNNPLNSAVSSEEEFFCAAGKGQRLLDISVTGIEARATAESCKRGATASPLDQGLQRTVAPAIGQVGHVEDHGEPWGPDRFRNQVALMRHENPLGINRHHYCQREMSGSGDALHGPIQAPSEAIDKGTVPWTAGEHEQ